MNSCERLLENDPYRYGVPDRCDDSEMWLSDRDASEPGKDIDWRKEHEEWRKTW